MSIADLIKKRTGEFATATPAIPATRQEAVTVEVARIATIAVASPTGPKTAPLPDPAAEARRQRVREAGAEPAKPAKPPVAEVLSVLAVPNPALSGEIEAGEAAGTATVAVASPPSSQAAALPDPSAEARRQRVLAMLADHPEARYAIVTDMLADPAAVIVALAIRGQASCELRIPRERYDGTLLLDLIEKHGAGVH